MIQSAPSFTALATSLISARVGTGDSIIDSSICVATMTGFPADRLEPTAFLWMMGSSSKAHSIPKSPLATINASAAWMISSMLATPF